MKAITKILLVAGAGLGFWYIPTILAVLKLEISLNSFIPVNIRESKIDALVSVKLKNHGSSKVHMQWIKADILLNGKKIAEFYQTQSFLLLGNSSQNFNVNVTIDASVIGAELWQQILANNLLNSNLEVTGTLSANYKTLPFDVVWTVKDFANGL
jgi:LEA14-like dessication related protein